MMCTLLAPVSERIFWICASCWLARVSTLPNGDWQYGRVKEDQGLAHGALTLQADRTLGDSGSIDRTVDRAGREHTFFGADAGNQRWFEASRMGVQMPTAPKGEFKTAAGNSYRVLKGAKRTLYLWPDGIKRPTRPA